MPPYLRSHNKNNFIQRLPDWELWQIMSVLPDSDLVNLSSTCHRFRTIAAGLSAQRAEMKPYTNIIFDSVDGWAAKPRGPNGKSNYWIHPLEIIHGINQTPHVAGYIKTINTVIMRKVQPETGTLPGYKPQDLKRLRTINDMRPILSRLLFLPGDRASLWEKAIHHLNFAPALLLLILLCYNLESLTIRDLNLDGDFDEYLLDLSPMMRPTVSVNNRNQQCQIAIPSIRLLTISPRTLELQNTNRFRSILHLSLIPSPRNLRCSGINELGPQRYPPMQQSSSIRFVELWDSSISVPGILALIRAMPNLEELLYDDNYAVQDHGARLKRYRQTLQRLGVDLLQKRNLEASVYGPLKVPLHALVGSGSVANGDEVRQVIRIRRL